MRFEWDPAKAASNLRKHGIGFDEAVRVFSDPLRDQDQDRYAESEERWLTIGRINHITLVVVVHTTGYDEQQQEVIRIISARRATPHERRGYERDRFGSL